jgi:hypothetical protein
LTEILFGTETDPKARFIQLEDCGHVLEASGLDNWIKSSQLDSEVIKLPECPKCRTPIRTNLRYSAYIKKQLASIEQVKKVSLGDERENRMVKYGLIQEIYEFAGAKHSFGDLDEDKEVNETLVKMNHWAMGKIYARLANRRSVPKQELISLKNVLSVVRKVDNMERQLKDYFPITSLVMRQNKEAARKHLAYEMDKFKPAIVTSDLITNEKFAEIVRELDRVENLFKYYRFKVKYGEMQLAEKKDSDNLAQQERKRTEDLLVDIEVCLIKSVAKYCEKRVASLFETLSQLVALEISEQERVEIVKAIGLSKGHWFKCAKGHVYCIGECGGAMEKAQCPECGETIGGERHTLAAGNMLAPEMDQAQFPAFSERANIENFDLNNIH